MSLESERFNTDYLTFRKQVKNREFEVEARAKAISEETVEQRVKAALIRERDLMNAQMDKMARIYFDAGRWAAGARDSKAYKANEAMKRIDK